MFKVVVPMKTDFSSPVIQPEPVSWGWSLDGLGKLGAAAIDRKQAANAIEQEKWRKTHAAQLLNQGGVPAIHDPLDPRMMTR